MWRSTGRLSATVKALATPKGRRRYDPNLPGGRIPTPGGRNPSIGYGNSSNMMPPGSHQGFNYGGGHRPASEVLLTRQKTVKFPPEGSGLLALYTLLVMSTAALDIISFYRVRKDVEDLARQAKSGETFLGPGKAASTLLLLDSVASGLSNDSMLSSGSSFPNWFPRIFNNGGMEAIQNALASKDPKVVASAAQLAHTASVRPKAAKAMMENDDLRTALVKAFKSAVDAKICDDCGGSSCMQMMPLLDVFASSIRYYPFGKDPTTDNLLRLALEKVAQRAVHFAFKGGPDELDVPLLLEVPPRSMLPGLIPPPHLIPGADWGGSHDPLWHIQATNMLLRLSLEGAFDSSSKPEKVLPILVEPTLLSLNQLYQSEMLDEEQSVYFGLLCSEVIPHSKGFDVSLAQTVENFNQSFVFRNRLLRKMIKSLLDNFELVAMSMFSVSFGYLWGVMRTLIALRDVQPPLNTLLPQAPEVAGMTRAPAWTEPRAWRWMMARQHGFRAGIGATAFVNLVYQMSDFSNDHLVESDTGQVAIETSYAIGSVAACAYLLKNSPYFFFPALMAHVFATADVDDNSVQISLGNWPPRGRPTKPPRGPDGGTDSGKWT